MKDEKKEKKVNILSQIEERTADMVHALNSPFMIISGRAKLSLMEDTTNEEIKENLLIIKEECEKCREIVEKFRQYINDNKAAP